MSDWPMSASGQKGTSTNAHIHPWPYRSCEAAEAGTSGATCCSTTSLPLQATSKAVPVSSQKWERVSQLPAQALASRLRASP